MRTPPKDLGTRQETATVRAAQETGLIAERLPEGGAQDRGDIRILTDHEWVIEVKFTQRLNIHEALEKALAKSETPYTAVLWRRMERKEGNVHRTQVGVPIVALTLEMFLELLKGDT